MKLIIEKMIPKEAANGWAYFFSSVSLCNPWFKELSSVSDLTCIPIKRV
jgi:hypothetical protein